MVSLKTAGLRFNSIMRTETGFPFAGSVEPAGEGEIPARDFSYPRLLLRVSRDCPVVTGAIIVDVAERRFLLADHDISFAYNQIEYRTHRMFQMTHQLVWKRQVTTADPLTGLDKGTSTEELDTIWALVERQDREFSDTTMRVKEEHQRVITGTEVQLGDILDDRVVKRVDPVLGVWMVEIQ